MSKTSVSIICSLYQGEKYLASYLEDVKRQTLFDAVELIFVHNLPTLGELTLIKEFASSAAPVSHLKLDALEPLPASWNRGLQQAQGEFVTIWNVDDRREADSLQRQMERLLQSPELAAVYGDYIEVPRAETKQGTRRTTPEYEPNYFMRSFPQGGAFTLWRRSAFQDLGGFDEQLRVGPDMEHSLRTAATGRQMGKVPGLLGYFTNESAGLSTRQGRQPAAADRSAIQLRYAVYDKLDPDVPLPAGFDPDRVLVGGEWQPLERYWPQMHAVRRSRAGLKRLGRLRFGLRAGLSRLGLLNLVHAVQKRITNKDL
jgi:hypothetical protein